MGKKARAVVIVDANKSQHHAPPCHQDGGATMVEDTKTVLIVDDDHVILDFLEDVLQRSYTVIRADNGKAAVDVFRAIDYIALVLLDLAMPEMSGYEALAEFQIVEPDVKVVVDGSRARPTPRYSRCSRQPLPGSADFHDGGGCSGGLFVNRRPRIQAGSGGTWLRRTPWQPFIRAILHIQPIGLHPLVSLVSRGQGRFENAARQQGALHRIAGFAGEKHLFNVQA